jgi:hypothetical protein
MNQFPEAFSKEGMIVHDDNPFRVRLIALRILIGGSGGTCHFHSRVIRIRGSPICPMQEI